MEFAAAAFASIASVVAPAAAVGTESIAAAGALAPLTLSGVGAAVGGTAAAGGGLMSWLGGASTVGSILSGAATVGSVINAQRGGDQQGAMLDSRALDTETSMRAESVQGLARGNSLRQQLITQIGQRDVSAAASGADLSFGTPALARAEDVKAGSRALDLDQSTTDYNRSVLAEQAANLRAMAAEARQGGLAKAAGLGLTGAASLLRRGNPQINW